MTTLLGSQTTPGVHSPSKSGPNSENFRYSMVDFPSTLDLIASNNAFYWTKMIDLSSQLSPAVQQYNAENPDKAIRILGKAEFNNPGMSHKDRIAKRMLECAVEQKELQPGQTIIAASSGNTGASLALVGQQMGYPVVIITDSKCSTEKKAAIRSYGAELWVLYKGFDVADGISKLQIDETNATSVSLRNQLHQKVLSEKLKDPRYKCDYMKIESYAKEMDPKNYFSAAQYDNHENLVAHYESTGHEIFLQTAKRVTHFVMAASTGGTVMGVGKTLKESKPSVKILLSDPKFSRLYAYWQQQANPEFNMQEHIDLLDQEISERKSKLPSGHDRVDVMVEGAGKGRPTVVMMESDRVLPTVDDVVVVEDIDAFAQCRKLADDLGLLVGGSAGLNIAAASKVADDILAHRLTSCQEFQESIIVTLLCDHGIKYLSKIYNDSWLSQNFTETELLSNSWLAKKMGRS
mmetsp:Transcript_3449/g.6539  ORF Transcript_3449/g.6539 Transcript_3449/m.6539 type:complete len:463 (-) Transcript_3449:368-1756(-)